MPTNWKNTARRDYLGWIAAAFVIGGCGAFVWAHTHRPDDRPGLRQTRLNDDGGDHKINATVPHNALPPLWPSSSVETLIAAFGDKTNERAGLPQRYLKEKPDSEVIPALINALKNTDPQIRTEAARMLGFHYQDPSSTQPLLALLNDANEDVALTADLAVLRITAPTELSNEALVWLKNNPPKSCDKMWVASSSMTDLFSPKTDDILIEWLDICEKRDQSSVTTLLFVYLNSKNTNLFYASLQWARAHNYAVTHGSTSSR